MQGGAAEHVAAQLDAKLRDALKARSSQFSDAAAAVSGNALLPLRPLSFFQRVGLGASTTSFWLHPFVCAWWKLAIFKGPSTGEVRCTRLFPAPLSCSLFKSVCQVVNLPSRAVNSPSPALREAGCLQLAEPPFDLLGCRCWCRRGWRPRCIGRCCACLTATLSCRWCCSIHGHTSHWWVPRGGVGLGPGMAPLWQNSIECICYCPA